MNKRINSIPSNKHIEKISKALFVLSQIASKRKFVISELRNELAASSKADPNHAKLEQKFNHLNKTQRYFHSDRTEVMRYLINSGLVNVKGYIADSGYNFGVVKVGNYELYLILNKKIIQKLKLEQIGSELGKFELLSDEERNLVMSEKEAEKELKLYLAKIRSEPKKDIRASLDKDQDKDVVISKTVSTKGNIVVVKKRKFSKFMSSGKPNV